MRVHVHDWQLGGQKWICTAPDHIHEEPDILDAATVWHILGVIKIHGLKSLWVQTPENTLESECSCGWKGEDYYEHLDDAIFYWLKDVDGSI